GQIPEPVRDLGLQVTMGQTSCLLATQPLQRLREQPTQGTERVLVGFQRVRLHPGLLLSRFGFDTKTVEKEPPHISINTPMATGNAASTAVPGWSHTQTKPPPRRNH